MGLPIKGGTWNIPLSSFLLDTIKGLDTESPDNMLELTQDELVDEYGTENTKSIKEIRDFLIEIKSQKIAYTPKQINIIQNDITVEKRVYSSSCVDIMYDGDATITFFGLFEIALVSITFILVEEDVDEYTVSLTAIRYM